MWLKLVQFIRETTDNTVKALINSNSKHRQAQQNPMLTVHATVF